MRYDDGYDYHPHHHPMPPHPHGIPTSFIEGMGPPGETPDIYIKAHTIEPEADCTVTKSGTLTHPVFDFGIPQGAPGRDGIDGKDGIDGRDGKDGQDGKDGYTPIKGVDYFDGEDGYTPIKGVDYFDGKDGADGIDGKDGKDGKDGVVIIETITNMDIENLLK